jgi:hypothetical protein
MLQENMVKAENIWKNHGKSWGAGANENDFV